MLNSPTLASLQGSKFFPNPHVSLGKADTIGPGNSGCKIWFLLLTRFPASCWVPSSLKVGTEDSACQRSYGTLSGWLECAAVTETDSQDSWTELTLQNCGSMLMLKQTNSSASLRGSDYFTFVFGTGVGTGILLLLLVQQCREVTEKLEITRAQIGGGWKDWKSNCL